MPAENEIIRELWEHASDEDIVRALYVCPDEYNAEAIEILSGIAKRRGLDSPEPTLVERLQKERKAREAAEGTARPFVVCDKLLLCHACGNDRFRQQQLADSTLGDVLGLADSDHILRCAICARCGYIHWFA